MSAIKEHYHDQIEQGMRCYTGQELRQAEYLHNQNSQAETCPKYDILELSAMSVAQLVEIAAAIGLVVGDAKGKQTLIDTIFQKQNEHSAL